MFLKTKAKRMICGALSVAMLAGNIFSGITAYAIGANPPVNADGTTPNGNKPQDTTYTENAYVNDTPLRLQVSKVKTAVGDHEGIAPENTSAEQTNTITYLVSGRIDGSEADIINNYGSDYVELAYSSSGVYLGYGWQKGTLEYLMNRQAQNLDEDVQIIYNEYGVFDGFAYITRTLETADDTNRYVAGATMGLYEAVEIFRDPSITRDDSYYGEDERFTGVTVVRDSGSNNVTSVYVNKGYAGTKVEYVIQKEDETKVLIDAYGNVIDDNYNYQDAINDTGDGVWIAKTIQREDTPILFYSLDNLNITSNDVYTNISSQNQSMLDDVFGAERYNKEDILYGFDKDGNVIDITQMIEQDFSVFAFEAGTNRPVYEFVGGDFNEIKYNMPAKVIEVGEGTIMYHLDSDGNRDSMVDPQTGIAYIEETITPPEGHDNIHHVNDTNSTENTKIYVWPVNVFHDGSGANSGNANGSMTFQKIMTTRIATINADTAQEYTTGTYNGTDFEKNMNPVLDKYGHPVYYRKSDQTYVKGEDTWDYDGDEYTGYTYKDSLDAENEDAYTVNDHDTLYNGDEDNPFDQSTHYQYSDQQQVKLTIDVDGNYIVNGNSSVPVPVRSGYVFAGWLLDPDGLTDGGTVNAWWRNQNSTGMSDEEEQQWYSDRQATGTTRTITVTFNANGGEFRSGTGDIHSTDNILYRRLGDAYLIENVWTTGENTPNDPFDTQKVDTVGNTAANSNTISGTGKTGNDVYSSTNAGGQADMLKRVNAGVYIMEEIKSPAGYVKGLPVGVTVNEHTDLQYAEMTDTTIKTEFVKVDATDSYTKNLYIDGVLQVNDAGKNITVQEPKGAYSFTHVPGATISLKGRDAETKKAFSDWVKVTENKQITKKTESGYYYFEFQTDKPLFLEGMPAGNYVLSEVVTPDGYVTMADQNITVYETDGVQMFAMNDDHTKVEVEKYYSDGISKQNLPNAYRAELTLTDKDGNSISSWYTDDLSDYTNDVADTAKSTSLWQRFLGLFNSEAENQSFIELFQSQVKDNGTSFASISWEVTREAVRASYSTDEKETWIISDGSRIVCENGSAPDSAPQIFIDAYNTRNQEENSFTYKETLTATKDTAASKTLSDQVWNVSNGSKIHISVYGDNDTGENGRQSYIVDFKFNYRNDYTGKYANTISYDSIDGYHRFDYLPEGSYIIKETETPEGFVTAANQAITVKGTGDVQRFTVENKKKQLEIAKVAEKDGTYYAGNENDAAITATESKYAAVIPGATLTLYYSENQIADYTTAFANGNTPAGVSMADTWVSGTDGKYTESEYIAELIREDQVGDYKPHTVTDIQNGWYYLVETQTPAYYKTFEPIEIHVTDLSTSDVLTNIQAVNTPIPMEVKVFKDNKDGSPLSGAVFSVNNKTLGGIQVGTLTTDETGYGTLVITDTGRFASDGSLEPYTFTIEEVSAPAGYKLNTEIHEFTASATGNTVKTIMENTADGSIVNGVLYITDEPSQLTISKSDFDDGAAVPGTTLAIYEAVNENGKWKNSGITQDGWTWTIKDNEISHEVTGLAAGGIYVLTEVDVPAGYTKADDIFFKVSANGAAIEKVWYDPEENVYITFTADSTGAVESVTFSTRTVLGTYVELEDLDTGIVSNKGTLKGGVVNLSSDDVVDGHRYQMRECIKYSDSTVDYLGTTTFIAKLYNNWMKLDLNKDLADLTMEITDSEGDAVVSFKPDNTGYYTVVNPLETDSNGLTVVGSILRKYGVNHTAVQAGNQIRYQIAYEGAGKEIVIIPAKGLTYISCNGFTLGDDGYYRMTTEKESGTLTFIATVDANASGYVNQQISIDGKPYSYLNPIAVNYGDGIFHDTSKLVLSSAVAGTHPDNENAAFTFRITLTLADGSPLAGSYDYRTRYTNGQFYAYGKETEFEITVNGNDFVTISDLPYNTKYSIVQLVPDDYQFVVTNTEASGRTSNTEVSNVLFTNTRNATTERTLFVKNTGYVLSELLNFTDSDSMLLTKYGFSFGENCQIKDLAIYNKQTEVWFTKLDWTDCEEVEGATCVLMDEDGNVLTDELGNEMRWVSTTEPKKFVGVLEAGKTYRYHEEKSPDGYGYSEDVVFTVSEDGTIDKVIMQDKPTVVDFMKEDFAGNEVANATCELKVLGDDGNFEAIDTWVSGTTPHRITGILTPEKTYQYHEAAAPDGYAYSEDIEFTLDKDGNVTDAHYVNADGTPILYDKDGYQTTITAEQTVDADGNTVTIYKDGDTVVTIDTEGNAVDADGTIHAAGVQYDIEVTGNVIRMKDAPTDVVFLKADDTTGKSLAGATLQVIDKNGKVVAQWITDETGKFELVGKLLIGETYKLHEEATPDGYYYSYDVEFTVNEDGKEQIVEMRNRQIRVETPPDDIPPKHGTISKRDTNSKKELAGAVMQITNAEGTVVDSWTSDGTAHKIPDNLPDGIYTVAELTPPAGYQKSADINFTVFHSVVQSGVILYDKHDVIEPPTPPETPGIYIYKLDAETNVILEGGRFEIRNAEGNLVESWESNGSYHKVSAELQDGIYTLHETKAPSGYMLAEDVTFTVADGKVNGETNAAIIMKDAPLPPNTPPDYPTIWLLKNSVNDPNHILKGGTFQVLDEAGNVVIDNFTMDGAGQNWNTVLIADHTFYLHEVTPPEGYQKAEDVKFTVSHYGEDMQVVMTDKETEVIIKKLDQHTGLPLEGTVLELYKGEKKEPYAEYEAENLIARWTTDETGEMKLTGVLELGMTYTLHETVTVKGYYYSYDQEFTVGDDGVIKQNGVICKDNVVTMQNRPIIVETPPDEFPEPEIPTPETPKPEYIMEKERTSLAPEKDDTGKYGFFKQDIVYYDVTIKNTGNIPLTMDVNDKFEKAGYFSIPEVDTVRFYHTETGRQHSAMGQVNSIDGSKTNITIQAGAYAVVTYKATVKDSAKEFLSDAAADDGLGYVNTATTTNVVGKYYEYSGEDKDGDGKPDDVIEKTVTKEDYPDELGDKEDDANTPVQEPEEPAPRYTMEKERVSLAPEKVDDDGNIVENRYGFWRGDTVTYKVTIKNTGDMPLKMYVSDEFAYEIRNYFKDLKITDISFDKGGSDISETGMGIGEAIARIRLEVGETAEVTYTAVVSDIAPERLSYMAVDDGNGYLNTAKTYSVKAEKPDGTEGGPEEYPGIPDMEDDANTPVQNPEDEPETPPPGPDEPSYPIIWLLKNSVNDPSHILPGGSFQVLDKDGNIMIDTFTMDSIWQAWYTVLEADKTYYLHEVTPPEGYIAAEDVAFTVSHYGEPVEAVMTDETTDVKIYKTDEHTGLSLASAVLEVYKGPKKEPYAVYDEADLIGRWVTDSTGLIDLSGILEVGETYTLHESVTVKGYYYSYDQEFMIDANGQAWQDGKAAENNRIVMQNRPIIVETPPDELPEPEIPETETPKPEYTMEKERVTDAPQKSGTIQYGFFKEDIVYYDVTIKNTGNIELTMNVDDAFEISSYFSTPEVSTIRYYETATGRQHISMGQTNIISGSRANITIQPGGYAVVTYKATVKEEAKEFLSNAAVDDGMGYVNTATTTDVVGRYYEYGENDEPIEKTVTKEDYPEELGDKEDDANTPVQEPEDETPDLPTPETPNPEYTMEKERTSLAPEKGNTDTYGFYHDDIVYYDVTVKNTGNIQLTMDVNDGFEEKSYFSTPEVDMVRYYDSVTNAERLTMGQTNSISGSKANITIQPGGYAVVTYKATVKEAALELLSNHTADDGLGYVNTATTTNVVGKYYEYGADEEPTEKTVTKEDYPDELGDKEDDANTPVQEPEDENPRYTMDKQRVTNAPEKDNGRYGFKHGDTVTYKVTINNTGNLPLKMYVSDEFAADIVAYFDDLKITAIRFTGTGSDISGNDMGIGTTTARIRLDVGAKAEITYTAVVSDSAPENLSYTAADDGNGYLNIAKTYDVKAEKPDGSEGGPDEYPDIPDKEDDGHTPVQDEDNLIPSYTMEKERVSLAPAKIDDNGNTVDNRYGFHRGDTVTYKVTVNNTGDLPLKIYVSDEFAYEIRTYFEDLKITNIRFTGIGSDISETGMGVGTTEARIRLDVGAKAEITYTAVVSDTAPERLAYMAADDGNGYLNIAKTYNVQAENPDGTEDGPEKYPGIPDKEDEGNTPVQNPEEEPETPPPGPDEPKYPIIYLLKNSVNDPSHILPGGSFQVIDEAGNVLIDTFTMESIWKAWYTVLEADKTYYLHEVTPPEGYTQAEDVAFTVSHYGEPVEVVMTDSREGHKVTFTKEDYAGAEIPGATCELSKINPDGSLTKVDSWVSDGTPRVENGTLELNTTYRYHEESAPNGYGYSEDIEFTIDKKGVIKNAHYINSNGEPILYDKDGFPTSIVVNPDGTYTDGDYMITIDKNGNAVDENGEIHAEGVQYYISIVDNVIQMKDAPTKVLMLKIETDGSVLSGGTFQILDMAGEPVKALITSEATADGTVVFTKGSDMIFTASKDGIDITGQLNAGTNYVLRELVSPAGYTSGEDVIFRVPYLNQKEALKVTMENMPTKIQVLKVDTDGNGIAGATLEIRDAVNGDLMDSWTSDGTAHDVTGILAVGKEYVLVEETAPAGYYKADPVKFTVKDTSEVQTVTMTDEPIVLKLVKVRANTSEQLSGGKFSVIRKADAAVVIPEFELNGEITITGKLQAGVTYLFHEITPPSGYYTSGDVEFTIPVSKQQDVITVTMENTKKPSGGGGGGGGGSSTSTPPTLTFKKYDGLTMKALPGAEFTIYDSNDKVYRTVTTNESGYATVTFSTVGTYYYQETKAPDGYVIDNTKYSFEVTKSMSTTKSVANYTTPPNVTITKKDADTGDVISGVRFEITNENGEVVYKGTTDAYGQITFTPGAYGAYAVRETKVPKDYEISDGYITFTVREGGVEGDTVFYNSKEKPVPPAKRGVIDASYDNGADGYGKGWFDRDGNWHPFANPSKTGDWFPFAILGIMILCGTGGLVFIKRKKKGEGNEEA